MSEKYKVSDLQYVEEVWQQGNTSVFEDIFQTNYGHNKHASRDAHQKFIATYRGAFPNVHFTIEDHFVAGDRTVMRWTGRGTHSGELNGLVPTGKEITITGILISRYADGKVFEHRNVLLNSNKGR